MLIRNAELYGFGLGHLRIAGGKVAAMGQDLQPGNDEVVLEAEGGALLPGLHEHHLHLLALAAALESVPCGPPQVHDAEELARALALKAAEPQAASGDDWLRGTGYHESVAGDIDRHWLDRVVPDRPVRVQHRSGRLWILNSRGLECLKADADAPLERIAGQASGRLYDADAWLRQRLGSRPPSLARVGRLLASYGVTGVTDTSQHNGPQELAYFAAEQARGHLPQAVLAMGDARLDGALAQGEVQPGHFKVHLHENELPPFDALGDDIRRSHKAGRHVAFHCVTRTELVFACAALEAAGVDTGTYAGDRIEHASVAPPETLPPLAALARQGLVVVTQPNFIRERGDIYLREVEAADRPWLYRARGLLEAGIPLAAGTDAPYGDPNPWLALEAAVTRRSVRGQVLGADEALSPEQALALFTSPADQPGGPARQLAIGVTADLCLLDRPWAAARAELGAVRVRATWRGGQQVWQAPVDGELPAGSLKNGTD
jgi:predicted amidohydrolase YtcJ